MGDHLYLDVLNLDVDFAKKQTLIHILMEFRHKRQENSVSALIKSLNSDYVITQDEGVNSMSKVNVQH